MTYQYVRFKPVEGDDRSKHVFVGVTHSRDEIQDAVSATLEGDVVALWNNPADRVVEQAAKQGQAWRSVPDLDAAIEQLKQGRVVQIGHGLQRMIGKADAIVAALVAAGWPVGTDEEIAKEEK